MTSERGELKAIWFPPEYVEVASPQMVAHAKSLNMDGVINDILFASGPLRDCILLERMLELSYLRLAATTEVLAHSSRAEIMPDVSFVKRGSVLALLHGIEFPGIPSTPEQAFRMSALLQYQGVDEMSYVAAKAALLEGTNQLMSEIGKPVNIPLVGNSTK